MTTIRCALLLSLLVPACVAADPGDDPSTATTSAAVTAPGGGGGGGTGTNCPWWGCGSNSPVIGPWNFHELDADGEPNDAGLQLVVMTRKGLKYMPEVIGAELVGHSFDEQSYPSIRGAKVAGAILVVDAPDGTYELTIHRVARVTPYWVGPSTLNYTYELDYQGPDQGDVRPVCGNPPIEDKSYPNALGALLFAGDRYDAKAKAVIATGVDETRGWFNIACAGSALAKLHLNRHTTAGEDGAYVAKRPQRQAMLKMFVSDVCGTGQPFTVPGEPLHYQNATKWMKLDGTETSDEALWTADGAICLDKHRLEANPSPLFPTIRQDIEDACALAGHKLPTCAELGVLPDQWQKLAYLLSANP